MKKYVVFVFMLSMMGCANTGIVIKEVKPEQIIHYSQFQKLDDKANLNNYVAYLNEGDTFPLKLSINLDLVGVNNKKIDLVAKQKIYFMVKMPDNLSKEELAMLENLNDEKLSKMSEGDKKKLLKDYMIYVSQDAIKWAPLSNLKAVKELLGIKGGNISFGVGMNKKEGIFSNLNIETVK